MMVALVSITGCGGEEMGEPSGEPSEVNNQAAADAAYLDELFPERQNAYDPRIQHKAPAVPIMIDGELHPPEAISRFNGGDVIYLMSDEGRKAGYVHVFANPKKLREYLEAHGQMPAARRAGVTAMNTAPATFYQNSNFGGAELSFAKGIWVPNLKDHFMFWPVTWNDEISSVRAAAGGSYTVLYGNSNYWGGQVWIRAGEYDHDLSWANFDNVASSIKVLD
jgi:hypothetical protein